MEVNSPNIFCNSDENKYKKKTTVKKPKKKSSWAELPSNAMWNVL